MVQRISEFDIWRPGYGGAVINVFVAGTTTPANIYTDEALTIVASNPQTLSSIEKEGGTRYGKFLAPLYTSQSYYISIDGIENTGTMRATFSSLSGEDASAATVKAVGSSYAVTIANVVGRQVNASNFGEFVEGSGGVAATNTSTLELAIAALSNGGEVSIPSGTYKVNSLSIPEGVVIVGQGREATILQSVIGSVSFTYTGKRAGFKNITLDGSSLSSGSIAIKSVGKDETVFDAVMIRRFETGIHYLGGKGHIWKDFSIENTVTGAKLHGDTDAGDTSGGDAFEDLLWTGGLVSVATTIGVSLSYEDAVCHNINLITVGFESCTGTALDINGSQSIEFIGCWFKSNTKDVNIKDDTAILTPTTEGDNDVIGVHFRYGRWDGGEFEITGTAQDVIIHQSKIEDVDFTLTTPLSNYLILEDCFEDSAVTISGESSKLIRQIASKNGSSFGVTINNTTTKAWGIALDSGQMVNLEAKVIARGRNVAQRAIYHISTGAYRVGASLNYDTQTANFTAGAILTGASSGATARIQADADAGATGTLTLIDIKGSFIDNEVLADDNGTPGAAIANGVLSYTDATLDSVGDVAIRTAYETNVGWSAAFVANGGEIEFRVTGDTGQTVEWTVDIDVVGN